MTQSDKWRPARLTHEILVDVLVETRVFCVLRLWSWADRDPGGSWESSQPREERLRVVSWGHKPSPGVARGTLHICYVRQLCCLGLSHFSLCAFCCLQSEELWLMQMPLEVGQTVVDPCIFAHFSGFMILVKQWVQNKCSLPLTGGLGLCWWWRIAVLSRSTYLASYVSGHRWKTQMAPGKPRL